MRRLIILFLLALPQLACADTASSEKKYPPYPDVWGYELPYPSEGNRYSHIDPLMMENGDIYFTYVQKKTQTRRKDGTCCDFDLHFAGLSFFLGEKHLFTGGEYNAFRRANRERELYPNPWIEITFSDGTHIKQRSTGGGNCYGPYRYYLEKRDKAGNVVARKTLLYVLNKPNKIGLIPSCGDGEGDVIERAASGHLNVIDLKDDSFLIYEYKGNVILRLDKNLNTQFPLNGRVFLIDTAVIDTIKKEAKSRHHITVEYYQYINDAVYDYLLMLKERSN